MKRVAVMGAGSWGTAFAQILADAGCEVTIWGRDGSVVEEINSSHSNSSYHAGRELPDSIKATTDSALALADADVVVLAIPAQVLRKNLVEWKNHIREESIIVSLLKGIEGGTSLRMTEVIEEVLGCDRSRIAIVTGPNLAGELIARQPAASVVAATSKETATLIQSICGNTYFRPYTSTDVLGCELGGTIKNVIALAVGMASAMGNGDNTKASVITRGLAETARLGAALGADPTTFAGLAGLGDLVATCSSPLSRNRTLGEYLGRGLSLEEAVRATNTTAEGVASSRAVLELARHHGIDMPITTGVVAVIDGQLTPTQAVQALMGRSFKAES
jgi:glycerol-3-phosphate dehydrogenase (NAD(P)+)